MYVQICMYMLQPTSDLLGLIQVLAIIFGEEPPVFSRSALRPHPPPYPAAGATPYPTAGMVLHLPAYCTHFVYELHVPFAGG